MRRNKLKVQILYFPFDTFVTCDRNIKNAHCLLENKTTNNYKSLNITIHISKAEKQFMFFVFIQM